MERLNTVESQKNITMQSNIIDMNRSNGSDSFSVLENVVLQGDLSKLSPKDRVFYYNKVCSSLGLNPITKPFDYLTLNGKTMLYARKDATEQLRKIHELSIEVVSRELVEDIYVVTARASDKNGRRDESIGAINISGLRGADKANAFMKAETKAKRRVTLSIAGLGIMDETEVSSVKEARLEKINIETGEIEASPKMASLDQIKNLKDLVENSPYERDKIFKEFNKGGFSSYSKMTAEYANKMIEWLSGNFGFQNPTIEVSSPFPELDKLLHSKYPGNSEKDINAKCSLVEKFFGTRDFEKIRSLPQKDKEENLQKMKEFFESSQSSILPF